MIAEPVAEKERVEMFRRSFTVAEFMRMGEVGLFGEDERVELIQGEIVEMSPINVLHASTIARLISVLGRLLSDRTILFVQSSVQLDDHTLPQPDVALLKPRADFYGRQHPGPDACLLIIEVSDTTLSYDRRTKSVLYAAAGIGEYWIVNLSAKVIEVYREPRPDGYRTVTRYAPGEMLSPLAFPDVALAVNDILGTES